MTDAIKMQLSAFVDGELSDEESELLIRRLSRDPALREQAAEYQAIGRAMRAEHEPAGMSRLLQGVRDGIDGQPAAEAADETSVVVGRPWIRTATGLAVAAGVAAVALLGASQWSGMPETTADSTNPYTVPTPDAQDLYPADGLDARLVTLEIGEGSVQDKTDETVATDQEAEQDATAAADDDDKAAAGAVSER